MKITRRMEWPYIDKFGSIEEVSEYCQLLYQTLTEESALRAVELDVAFTDGYNVFLGHEAGASDTISLDDTEGIYNVFIGHQAGYSNTTGIKNIAIGYKPLYTNTTGDENTALGSEALYSNTTGANNVALGNDALYTNATGNYNVAVGFEALKVNTTSNNVAVGYQALVANTSGANNVALGYQTLDANSTGASNVAIGESALTANTTASYNLAIGYNALASNTDGHTNVAIGHSALTGNTSADFNVAIGYQALGASNTGDKNVAIGRIALNTNTSGHANIAMGDEALKSCTEGTHNIAVGAAALARLTSGDHNVAIGFEAGSDAATPDGVTTGDGNVFIGYQAGQEVAGSDSNKLYIANTDTATPLIYGDFSAGFLAINDNANTFMTAGLTINQAGNDNEILAFKSSDVDHGCTDKTETDTFGAIAKTAAADGGVKLMGFGEVQAGIICQATVTTGNTDKDSTARAAFEVQARKISGASWGAMGADENLFVIREHSATRFIVDEDGDILYDGSASGYQDYDDIALLAELEDVLSGKTKESKIKDKNICKEKIVYESMFVSTKKKNMLLYGAIRQMNKRIEALEAK